MNSQPKRTGMTSAEERQAWKTAAHNLMSDLAPTSIPSTPIYIQVYRLIADVDRLWEAVEAGELMRRQLGDPWVRPPSLTGNLRDDGGVCRFCHRDYEKGHFECAWLDFYEKAHALELPSG